MEGVFNVAWWTTVPGKNKLKNPSDVAVPQTAAGL